MSGVTARATTWVVLDASDRVVLICSGADAGELADEWRRRGYRVVGADTLGVTAA